LRRQVLKRQFISLVTLALLVSGACTQNEPRFSDHQQDSLVAVLVDLSIGFEFAERDSTAYFPIRDSILNSHGVDTVWLRLTSEAVGEDAERWTEIWGDMRARLEVLKDSLTP